MRLIDADYLQELITDYPVWNKFDKNRAIKMIVNAPTVEPDEIQAIMKDYLVYKCENRPQGEWKLHGMIYYCSECGHECGESGDNYCGNCGADMRGDNNG